MFYKVAPLIDAILKDKSLIANEQKLARVFHFSTHQLNDIFFKWLGLSFQEFLVNLKQEGLLQIMDLKGVTTAVDTIVKPKLIFESFKENESICYSVASTFLGKTLVASTSLGICFVGFLNENQQAETVLNQRFAKAKFVEVLDNFHKEVLLYFQSDGKQIKQMQFHLQGTEFQLNVWQALLNIPFNRVASYSKIAQSIGNEKAVRAVGTAVGKNPISVFIPCHRVIQSSGKFEGYHWGNARKAALIAWEAKAKHKTV